MCVTLHALTPARTRTTRAFRTPGGVDVSERSAANGHGACESGPSNSGNGGCQRPDCIYGLTRCGWHVQA